MSEVIRDFLKYKDDPKVTGAKMPLEATMNREEAMQYMFTQQQEKAYEIATAAKCMQPCFNAMDSPTVSQKEADCMTNCTAKGMETYVWFKYLRLTGQQ